MWIPSSQLLCCREQGFLSITIHKNWLRLITLQSKKIDFGINEGADHAEQRNMEIQTKKNGIWPNQLGELTIKKRGLHYG